MNTLRQHGPAVLRSPPGPEPFLKQIYRRYTGHSLADTAGALSYYFVFALFPFLFLLTTLTAHAQAPITTKPQTLLGQVTDSTSNTPLSGATIELPHRRFLRVAPGATALPA